MITIKDLTGRDITLIDSPKRVVSLIPSVTHTLFEIDCGDLVVGRTDFCNKPEEAKKIKSIGSPKKIDIDKIIALTPDLIIADVEENRKSDVEELVKSGFKVYIASIKKIEDIITFLTHMGQIFENKKVQGIIKKIERELSSPPPSKKIATFLPIWRNPYMCFNEETFLDDILKRCGFHNIFRKNRKKYFKLNEEEIQKSEFDLLMLPSEPYNFHELEPIEIIEDLKLSPHVKIAYIPGEWVAWYGAITPEGLKELKKLYRDYFKK